MPDLPSTNSPDLHLVLATPEEILAQQHANSTEWRGALSLEAYLRREEHLLNQVLTKKGGLTPWMLVHQPESGNGSRLVLCGCESIKKRALVARRGKVEDVACHGVASVFCPPEHRGKGYAGKMMEMLGERLRGWQDEEGRERTLFSVLFSDIGKEFYTARGWQAFPSTHISLKPAGNKPQTSNAEMRMLQAKDLPELCAIDEDLLRKRLAKLSNAGKTTVALIPEISTLQWHHAREDFVANELYNRRPSIRGALVGTEVGKRVWCYWTRVWAKPNEAGGNTLHILRLVIEDDAFSDFAPASEGGAKGSYIGGAIAVLFRVAQAEAAEWGMKSVQLWSPTSTTLAAARTIEPEVGVVQRESESIASLRWYGEGDWRDVEWVCNEKYGWC